MGLTNFPHGITSFGVPVLGGGADVTTGSVFFVHAGTGSDQPSPYGDSPDKPFATLEYAVSKCTDSKGDVVYLMPGHVETLTGAVSLDKSGISIIGLGPRGWLGADGFRGHPVLFFGATTANLLIVGYSITIENVSFVANIAAVASAITNSSGQSFTLRNCQFLENGADLNFLICVTGGTAVKSTGLLIEGCYALCADTDNTHFLLLNGTPAGVRIIGNILQGDWGVGCIAGATNVTGIITNCTIANNIIFNAATTADACINLAPTATGMVAYNSCGGGHATDGINVGDAAGIQNFYEQNTTDLSGVLEPASS